MDLTKEQQELLATQFPAEVEKTAQEQVKIAMELYNEGFSKLASEVADSIDAAKKEDEDKKDKKPLSEEQEKEAFDRAAFIARGYVDGLVKEGSERHANEVHYFNDAIVEKLAAAGMDAGKVKSFLESAGKKLKGQAHFAANDLKSVAKNGMSGQGAAAAGRTAARGAVLGAAGYGASKMIGSKEK